MLDDGCDVVEPGVPGVKDRGLDHLRLHHPQRLHFHQHRRLHPVHPHQHDQRHHRTPIVAHCHHDADHQQFVVPQHIVVEILLVDPQFLEGQPEGAVGEAVCVRAQQVVHHQRIDDGEGEHDDG